MSIITDLQRLVESLISLGPKMVSSNRDLRAELRSCIGDTADELSSGIQLMQLRLLAASKIVTERELRLYLQESPANIFGAFREFRVCMSLRNVQDRLNRLFDPLRASIELGQLDEVKRLLHTLEDHERIVFNLVPDLWSRIEMKIPIGSTNPWSSGARMELDGALNDLAIMRKEITEIARKAQSSI